MRISDWSSDVCSSDLVVLEALADGRAPHHRIEHCATVLADLDPLRGGAAALLAALDPDVDRLEAGHPQVVAGEGGRGGVRARRAGRPQREGGDVAAHRAPDLPVR